MKKKKIFFKKLLQLLSSDRARSLLIIILAYALAADAFGELALNCSGQFLTWTVAHCVNSVSCLALDFGHGLALDFV